MGFKKRNVKYLDLFQKPRYDIITDVNSMPKFNKKPSTLEELENTILT
ncbi:MAG: hypothetical protein KGD65_02160 [Candidatus Lokiarchaeota archaeon]|nr:hypothetical protein [Candidatus Lokiarchaeota archaeon]